jgi:hypothetical protein
MKHPQLLPILLPRSDVSGPEQVVYGVGRLLAKLGQDVRVDVHRHADLGVTEILPDGPWWYAIGEQERCTSMAVMRNSA